MNLIPYDKKYVPQPNGLINTGVICYFNSLCQSLMSLSAFNKLMLSYDASDNVAEIVGTYRSMLKGNKVSQELVKQVYGYRKDNDFQWNISPYAQEDAYEGFILLLEILGEDIQNHFHCRYKTEIMCHNCESSEVLGFKSCQPEFAIDMTECTAQTDEDIQKFICSRREYPDGYRCEHCGVKNGLQSKQIYKKDTLARLSSCLVLVYKNRQQSEVYGGNPNRIYLPKTLSFAGKYESMNYVLVAKVNHYGTLSGGHYTADCLRPCTKNNRERNLSTKETYGVFNMNDNTFSSGSFNNNHHTYLAFYQFAAP